MYKSHALEMINTHTETYDKEDYAKRSEEVSAEISDLGSKIKNHNTLADKSIKRALVYGYFTN